MYCIIIPVTGGGGDLHHGKLHKLLSLLGITDEKEKRGIIISISSSIGLAVVPLAGIHISVAV